MLTKKEKAEGWISLFDGETLTGWAATGSDEGWTVDDGAILCTVKGGGYLQISKLQLPQLPLFQITELPNYRVTR